MLISGRGEWREPTEDEKSYLDIMIEAMAHQREPYIMSRIVALEKQLAEALKEIAALKERAKAQTPMGLNGEWPDPTSANKFRPVLDPRD